MVTPLSRKRFRCAGGDPRQAGPTPHDKARPHNQKPTGPAAKKNGHDAYYRSVTIKVTLSAAIGL